MTWFASYILQLLIACTDILLPCGVYRWPPFRLAIVTDPQTVHPKRYNDEVSKGILPLIFWYVHKYIPRSVQFIDSPHEEVERAWRTHYMHVYEIGAMT